MSGTPTLALSAFGTLLQAYDNTGANPTTINGVTDVSLTFKLNTADASTMVSPDGWVEKIGIMKDGGSVPVTIQWVPNDPTGLQQQMKTDLRTAYLRKYNILEPGTPTRTCTFYALVTSIGRAYKFNGILVATVTLEMSGEPIDS